MLINAHTSYNIILGRPALNKLGAVVSSLHVIMKYPQENGRIGVGKADQQVEKMHYPRSQVKHENYKGRMPSTLLLLVSYTREAWKILFLKCLTPRQVEYVTA